MPVPRELSFVLFFCFSFLTASWILDGTLRWQVPELMSGSSQLSLTPQIDVYSYAILCVEIVGMRRLPWLLMDLTEQIFFTVVHARPPLPISPFKHS